MQKSSGFHDFHKNRVLINLPVRFRIYGHWRIDRTWICRVLVDFPRVQHLEFAILVSKFLQEQISTTRSKLNNRRKFGIICPHNETTNQYNPNHIKKRYKSALSCEWIQNPNFTFEWEQISASLILISGSISSFRDCRRCRITLSPWRMFYLEIGMWGFMMYMAIEWINHN